MKKQQEDQFKKGSNETIKEGLKESCDLFQINISKIETALSDLRIHIKYLLLDNEALKREKKYLIDLLADIGGEGRNGS